MIFFKNNHLKGELSNENETKGITTGLIITHHTFKKRYVKVALVDLDVD